MTDTVTELLCEHDTGTQAWLDKLPHINEDGRTVCCGAYTSIFTDDGVEYCKCCYREASWWQW